MTHSPTWYCHLFCTWRPISGQSIYIRTSSLADSFIDCLGVCYLYNENNDPTKGASLLRLSTNMGPGPVSCLMLHSLRLLWTRPGPDFNFILDSGRYLRVYRNESQSIGTSVGA